MISVDKVCAIADKLNMKFVIHNVDVGGKFWGFANDNANVSFEEKVTAV